MTISICLVRLSAIAFVASMLGACTVKSDPPTSTKSSSSATTPKPGGTAAPAPGGTATATPGGSTTPPDACLAETGSWECDTECASDHVCLKKGTSAPACTPLPTDCDPTMLVTCASVLCGSRTSSSSPGKIMCSACD